MVVFYFILACLLAGLCLLLVLSTNDVCRKLKEAEDRLKDALRERDKLARRSVESGLRLRAGNIVVPIYKPVAVIEAEGCLTIKDYDVIKRDGSILASNSLAFPINMVVGETFTMDFELLIQVSKMLPEQQ